MELLVVIAIVVVLVALSFSLFTRTRAQAQMVTDIGRLKEIGTLLGLFEADNNGSFPCPKDSAGSGTTDFNFPEALDRFPQELPKFDHSGKYNFQHRDPVLITSPSTKPFPGWNPQSSYPNLKGSWAFGFNKYLTVSYNWRGIMSKMPDRSKIVVVSCMNSSGNYDMDPDVAAVFENNVKTKYHMSYPGKRGLHLFCDFRVESLVGHRAPRITKRIPTNPTSRDGGKQPTFSSLRSF